LKFLGRARRFFQDLASEPETKTQHFNVTCASGHRVRGERTEGYQALRCPACGEGVFVLPRSPLPEPVAPARPSTSKPAGVREGWVEEGPVELTDAAGVSVEPGERSLNKGDADIIWDDTPDEKVTPPPLRRDRARRPPVRDDVQIAGPPDAAMPDDAVRAPDARGPDPSAQRPRQPDREARRAPPGGTSAPAGRTIRARRDEQPRSGRPRPETGRQDDRSEPEPAILEPKGVGRRRGLHRLLLALVPLLVMATVAWRLWRQRVQVAPLIAEKGRTQGIAALEEGNFDRAYQLLSEARGAVNDLRGAVEGADEIRDAAREAEIFVNLLSQRPEELLEELARTNPLSREKIEARYKGRTIVVDSWITAEPGPDGAGSYDLSYRILPDGESRSFREGGESRSHPVGAIDLVGFQLFELARPHQDQRVIFGAALAGVQYDDDRKLWVIRLEPKSGVFIKHTKALEALGWKEGTESAIKFPEETE
jgi:hypothetical protein